MLNRGVMPGHSPRRTGPSVRLFRCRLPTKPTGGKVRASTRSMKAIRIPKPRLVSVGRTNAKHSVFDVLVHFEAKTRLNPVVPRETRGVQHQVHACVGRNRKRIMPGRKNDSPLLKITIHLNVIFLVRTKCPAHDVHFAGQRYSIQHATFGGMGRSLS